MGAAAQASVPGVYAWGVTVAPAAWSRGASLVSKVAAIAAVLALLGGSRRGAHGPRVARGCRRCGVSSSRARSPGRPLRPPSLRFEWTRPRAAAGMIGWALFAFASAAPALRRHDEERPHRGSGPRCAPRPRARRWRVPGAGAVIAGLSSSWAGASPARSDPCSSASSPSPQASRSSARRPISPSRGTRSAPGISRAQAPPGDDHAGRPGASSGSRASCSRFEADILFRRNAARRPSRHRAAPGRQPSRS